MPLFYYLPLRPSYFDSERFFILTYTNIRKEFITLLQFDLKDKLNIHVIGAGGTGGYAIEYLARLFTESKHTIHAHDGDIVEYKNLKRQNFTKEDVDKNKATAIVERLNKDLLHAPKLVAHESYLGSSEEFLADILEDYDEESESLIIVLAVDNIATRKLVNETLSLLQEAGIFAIAIDSGNHDQGGQVVLYANDVINYIHIVMNARIPVTLKSMLQTYPELDKMVDENPAHRTTCEDHAESVPQAMMCNVRNADIIASIIACLEKDKSIVNTVYESDVYAGGVTASNKNIVQVKREG